MKLPSGGKAELGSKLEDYTLNPTHREGRHKARVFESVLGINATNKHVLAQALQNAAATSEAAEFAGHNGFGDTYVLRFTLETEQGTARVLSAWIVRDEEDFPRLTTCFIVQPVNGKIQMHDTVALLEDTPAKHFVTGDPIILRRGQMGAVVMTYDGSAFEVEFSGKDGRAYAMLPISADKLLPLREQPEFTTA